MVTKKQNTVYRYLRKYNVRTGVYKTPLFVLYYEYTRYCRLAECPVVSPIEFGRRISVYFEKGKSGRYAYYLTNVEPPAAKRRRSIRLWYNRRWSRMRNGEEEKGKVSESR